MAVCTEHDYRHGAPVDRIAGRSAGRRLCALLLVAALGVAGCAGQLPPAPDPLPSASGGPGHPGHAGIRAAAIARAMVGTPYRYGGTSPDGLDCSGLVYFSYGKAGVRVPRTSGAQRRASRPVARHALRPGDLLFFDGLSKTGHVGIYLGEDRFVHAPSSGKRVATARIDQGFFARRLSHIGRLTP